MLGAKQYIAPEHNARLIPNTLNLMSFINTKLSLGGAPDATTPQRRHHQDELPRQQGRRRELREPEEAVRSWSSEYQVHNGQLTTFQLRQIEDPVRSVRCDSLLLKGKLPYDLTCPSVVGQSVIIS